MVELMRVFSCISFGPFPYIADGAYTAEVDAGREERAVVFLNQIGEGEVSGVRIGDMSSYHERERTHACGPKNIGVRSRFGASFEDTLMDRAELVHVVTLIAARAGIHEGVHARNKEGGFVVGNGKRAGKNSACFTILTLAVAEEKAVAGGIAMSELAGLPHETTCEHGCIGDMAAALDNHVFANHAHTDGDGS